MESFQIIFQHLANADFYWQNGVNKCRNYGDYKALKNHICSRDFVDFARKNNTPFCNLPRNTKSMDFVVIDLQR